MVFNSFSFLFFFIAVLLLSILSTNYLKQLRLRNAILLISSYLFYASFSFEFIYILLYVTLVNYFSGVLITSANKVSSKKVVLCCCIGLTILPLLFYKYANFVISNLSSIVSYNQKELNILLPVGISFFTFQSLSYVIDLYRGKINACKNLLDFGLFVSFFPTILSGPIERARNLLPQFRQVTHVSVDSVVSGFILFSWGIFKKAVIADRLSEYIDWAYGTADMRSGSTLALAGVLYSIQIYCDFSGYSDMAIGVARSLGFKVMQNFNYPYFAHSIKEFWHRWHISLTSWFTEYVYFSLGGSRVKTRLRWAMNISLIFILSGIWHGAAWNFIIWGGMHAVLYLIEYKLHLQPKEEVHWWKYLKSIYVFILVSVAWVFFRVEDLHMAWDIVSKSFIDCYHPIELGSSAFQTLMTFALVALFIILDYCKYKGVLLRNDAEYKPCSLYNLMFTAVIILCVSMFSASNNSFVYFQF